MPQPNLVVEPERAWLKPGRCRVWPQSAFGMQQHQIHPRRHLVIADCLFEPAKCRGIARSTERKYAVRVVETATSPVRPAIIGFKDHISILNHLLVQPTGERDIGGVS